MRFTSNLIIICSVKISFSGHCSDDYYNPYQCIPWIFCIHDQVVIPVVSATNRLYLGKRKDGLSLYPSTFFLFTSSVKLFAALVNSDGIRTIVVVLLSIPISDSICILLNSRAIGLPSISFAP